MEMTSIKYKKYLRKTYAIMDMNSMDIITSIIYIQKETLMKTTI